MEDTKMISFCMKNPFMNDNTQKYISFAEIIKGLGIANAKSIALHFQDRIMASGLWEEEKSSKYNGSIMELLNDEPEFSKLFLPAMEFITTPYVIKLMAEAGYDGAMCNSRNSAKSACIMLFGSEYQ
jgi:hypothetical protein